MLRALVLAVLLAGCAAPPTASPSATAPPTSTVIGPTVVTEDDLADVGDPPLKRAFALDASLPPDYLDFDAARYDVHARTIHGTRVVVAIHADLVAMREIGGHPTRPAEETAAFLFTAFDEAWHVFGGHPSAEVRIVIRGPDEACSFLTATQVGFPICYQAHAHEPGDVARPPHPLTDARIPELVIHELFHAWNGGSIRATPSNATGFTHEAWWFEGCTTYYAARLSGNAERVMAGEAAKYERLYPEAGGLSFEDLAARTPKPGEGHNAYVEMLYTRGALVCEALDAELANGSTDLDAVARELYLRALDGETVASRDIEAAAQRVAQADLSAFFDAYLWGTQRVPPRRA